MAARPWSLTCAALCGCVTAGACASGREGEQYVAVVLVIVVAALVALIGSMAAGIVAGLREARRSGATLSVGVGTGLRKGLGYFVVACVAGTGAVMVLGVLWLGFAFVMAPAITEDCVAKGEPIQWAADYCMLKIQTDDEIAASDCIDEEMKKSSGSACDANARFKRGMCETMIRAGTRAGTVDACLLDPAFKGRTVEAGGVGR
jgi:hypothetical protein